MILRLSRLGATHPISIILLFLTLIIFWLSEEFDLSWKSGWALLFFALTFELVQSLRDLESRFYIFDSPLFCLGTLVFIVIDPVISLVTDAGFPAIGDSYYVGNTVGNITGFVICIFCLCFYLGRILVPSAHIKNFKVIDSTSSLKISTYKILILATIISLLAFMMNGEFFGLENLVNTITARTRGYVSFSTSGLGTDKPLISLFAQCIPTAIILWLISINRRKIVWSILAIVMALILFTLYVLLGGRSGMIFVLLTVAIFMNVRINNKIKISHMAIVGAFAVLILSFQANFRDRGKIGEDFFEHSPFRGFSLNREVSFIVDTYGKRIEFIRGQKIIPRIIMPIPETLALFIVNPIPRIIWANKPIDPSFGPYNELRTGKSGFGSTSNITPTIPGRYYMLYGYIGVIEIGILFGMLWRVIDLRMTSRKITTSNRLLCCSMLNAIMFISIRDLTFGKFYPFLFLIFFMYISKMQFSSKKIFIKSTRQCDHR